MIPEVWLRGPVDGIQPLLQPAAHTLLQVGKDVIPIVQHLTPAQLWIRPGGAASIGFHLAHVPGSLDRLLTYSRAEALNQDQVAALAAERTVHDDRPELARLRARFAADAGTDLPRRRALVSTRRPDRDADPCSAMLEFLGSLLL